MSTGPRKKTVKDRHGHKMVFSSKNKKVYVHGKLEKTFAMKLTDAQVRGLRNWLNWYLDKK